jgi:hypothetical protein
MRSATARSRAPFSFVPGNVHRSAARNSAAERASAPAAKSRDRGRMSCGSVAASRGVSPSGSEPPTGVGAAGARAASVPARKVTSVWAGLRAEIRGSEGGMVGSTPARGTQNSVSSCAPRPTDVSANSGILGATRHQDSAGRERRCRRSRSRPIVRDGSTRASPSMVWRVRWNRRTVHPGKPGENVSSCLA